MPLTPKQFDLWSISPQCLWKVSKTVKESLEDGTLDPRILLGDIDDFLVSIPPAEWRRRANDNVPLADMPLRTVKTILQQVVTIYGEGVYEAVSALKNPQDTFVYQYLFRLLNNSRAAAGEPPVSQPARRPAPLSPELAMAPRATAAMQQSPSRSPSRSRQSSAPSIDGNGPKQSPGPLDHFGEVNINNLLTEVFAKIGSPTESKKVRLHFQLCLDPVMFIHSQGPCNDVRTSLGYTRALSAFEAAPGSQCQSRQMDRCYWNLFPSLSSEGASKSSGR